MNKQILLPIAIIIVGLSVSGLLLINSGTNRVSNNVTDPITKIDATDNLRKVDLKIEGMFCLGCRSNVVSSVKTQPGIIQADADPSTDSGWVVYDPSQITKEQIVTNSIFNVYPAEIVDDKPYTEDLTQKAEKEIPSEITKKLNELAQKLKKRGAKLEPFFQDELDEAIEQGYFDKAKTILDNYLKVYE